MKCSEKRANIYDGWRVSTILLPVQYLTFFSYVDVVIWKLTILSEEASTVEEIQMLGRKIVWKP